MSLRTRSHKSLFTSFKWAKANGSAIGIAALIVACFLPYLSIFGFGIRVEQILIYGSLAILLPFTFRKLTLNRSAIVVLAAIALQLFVSGVGAVFFNRPQDLIPVGNLAGIDTFLLPISTIFIVAILARPLSLASPLLATAGRVLVVMCSLNVIIALVLQPRWSEASPLKGFWAWPVENWTVAEQAQLGFRFSGIFNQPAEAGFAYGLALAALIMCCKFPKILTWFFASLLILGGLLASSKAFYACAVVVGIYVLWCSLSDRHLVRTLVSASTVVAVPLVVLWSMDLLQYRVTQLDFLSRLTQNAITKKPSLELQSNGAITSDSAFVIITDVLTGHRIGPTSFSATVADQVLSLSPVLGFGISGWQVAYDSTWIEALVLSGLVGVGLSALIFLVLMFKSVVMLRRPNRSALLLVLTMCSLLTSIGIGALTANRASTIFWILVTLTAFGRFQKSRSKTADLHGTHTLSLG